MRQGSTKLLSHGLVLDNLYNEMINSLKETS